MKSIYKSKEAKQRIMALYEEKLQSLQIEYSEIDIHTLFGRTRVIKTGNENGQKVVLFHGINAGAPLTLEVVKELSQKYLFFAIDTIGQATKSDETTLNIKDNSYARWADEVLEKLGINETHCIGVSYGAYILQKLITFKPSKVKKCIFVVPSGLVNGDFITSITKLSFPLMRFMLTKKDKHLKTFLDAFVPQGEEFMIRLQKELLLGVNIDYRRPILLQKKDITHFTQATYIMVSDNDIFFPGEKAVERAKKIFKNIKGIHFLKNNKHMPDKSIYPEIQEKISLWLEE
jgi:pimeloyl-ACP methyl ester carboxylesterase